MTPLDTAISYTRRRWSVVPVPFRSKNPGFEDWQRLRLTETELPSHFNGQPQNIGVLLGEPSAWLVDADLDHLRCVELAEQFLPPTPAKFGRASKRTSHWIYRTTGPVASRRIKSRSAGTLAELRSTGAQTVFPPSTHESGEPIEWENPDAEPALIDPDELRAAIECLANAVKVELGEKAAPRARKPRTPREVANPAGPVNQSAASPEDRFKRCLGAMRAMQMIDHNDGSARLHAAACRVVEHDLDDAAGVKAIGEYARETPFPRDWTDDDVLNRIRDAEKICLRGEALAEVCIPLGQRDPKSNRLVLSPTRTLPTARAFIRDFHNHPDGRTLHSYAGTILTWRGNRFAEIELESIEHAVQPWLHKALRYQFNKQTRELELVDFDSNPATVNAAVNSIRIYTHLPGTTTPPAWLLTEEGQPDPRDFLPCLSGNLHIPTNTIHPATPALFNINALDFDFDPNPEPPERWIKFLEQLWGDDLESIYLLQEWMGYSLIVDTSQQKMLLMVGPRRSGKGTIGRVVTRLIGAGNVVGPTISSLGGQFGLQSLIGKSLAIVSDARFTGQHVGVVVERLLCISGEDTLTVDRKFLGSLTMKLPTRFMFLTNELPRMNDASGALAGRFVVLRLTRSFFGAEDVSLTSKLMKELPGILLWAIDGLKRLRQRGHFVQPQSVADAVRELEDLASPVGAFVRDCCEVKSGLRAWVDELYERWKRWCEREGRTVVTNKQTFGRDLAAAAPGVSRRRGAGDVSFYDGIALREPT